MRKVYCYGTIVATICLVLGITACHDATILVENNTTTAANKNKCIPDGMKPFTLNFGEVITDAAPVRATMAIDQNANNADGTRAIKAVAVKGKDTEDGQLAFKFDTKPSKNMMIIFKNKKTNNIIYMRDVCYRGLENGKLKITQQQLKGYANNAMPTTIKKGEKDWYAMFVYDNPKKVNADKKEGEGKYGLSEIENGKQIMKVGELYKEGKYLSSIGYSKKGDNKEIDDNIEIPFISNWTPVTVTADNQLFVSDIELKPQGVLLRIDVSNLSNFPCKVKRFFLETNMLHGNIKYDLSPNQLPNIDDKDANAHLKYEGIEGEYNEADEMVPNSKNLRLMGKSFVSEVLFDKDNELHATISAKNGKLKSHYFIWGMPKTNDEIKAIKAAGNIPVTALYVLPEVDAKDKNSGGYVSTNDDDFDQMILKGCKPAPALTYDLYAVSHTVMRNKDKTICNGENGGLIPVKVNITTRQPTPIEYLCQYHSIKSTNDNQPNFSPYKDGAYCAEERKNKTYFFGKDDITAEQPNGKTDYNKYRIKGPSGKPIDGYHIPCEQEIKSVLPSNNTLFGLNPPKNEWAVATLECYTWLDEEYKTPSAQKWVKSMYIPTSSALTAYLSGQAEGKVSPYLIGIRGLKMKDNKNTKFEYTDALGIYLYSAGYNNLFVEFVPLSKLWVERYNGNVDALMQDVLTSDFWESARLARICRQFPALFNYNGIDGINKRVLGKEPLGGQYWLSFGGDPKGYQEKSKYFGWGRKFITGDYVAIENKHSIDLTNCILMSTIYNKQRAGATPGGLNNLYYGVQLFHDKLWETTSGKRK